MMMILMNPALKLSTTKKDFKKTKKLFQIRKKFFIHKKYFAKNLIFVQKLAWPEKFVTLLMCNRLVNKALPFNF